MLTPTRHRGAGGARGPTKLARVVRIRVTFGPWLFGARLDLAAFTGSAALALAVLATRRWLGWQEELPEWGWVVLVLGVDVAHVYATLFRTYLDGAELRRHPARYWALPVALYAAGVALHLSSGAAFFRVLAYLAVIHFVRQQIGWAALYRSRGRPSRLDTFVDGAALYSATGYPLLHWHAHIDEKAFVWLVQGDFVSGSGYAARWLGAARALWIAALTTFVARQIWVAVFEKRVDAGRCLLVATTAVCWHAGIVGSTGDFDFTVTNVLIHGIPYMVLLYSYGRARESGARGSIGGQIVSMGAGAFLGVVLVCALVEEAGWDRLVWHDHEWLFGSGDTRLGSLAAALLVPLLALPQATHYVLDGLLWRRREPALRALGPLWPRWPAFGRAGELGARTQNLHRKDGRAEGF
jgi:hypothetical protein